MSMRTTRRNAMIVPNGQQSQHASRKRAMHCQVGTQNAVPVLYHTTGANRLRPALKEHLSSGAPRRRHSLQQRMDLLTKDLPTLPGPGDQLDRLTSQGLNSLLMSVLQPMSKMKQGRQSQLDQARHRGKIMLQAGRSLLLDFKQQAHQ